MIGLAVERAVAAAQHGHPVARTHVDDARHAPVGRERAQYRPVYMRRHVPHRAVGEVRAVRIAVAAIVIGVGGIDEPDPELRVWRHLETDAARPRVVRVDVHAAGGAALHRELEAAVLLRADGGMFVEIADQQRRCRVFTR